MNASPLWPIVWEPPPSRGPSHLLVSEPHFPLLSLDCWPESHIYLAEPAPSRPGWTGDRINNDSWECFLTLPRFTGCQKSLRAFVGSFFPLIKLVIPQTREFLVQMFSSSFSPLLEERSRMQLPLHLTSFILLLFSFLIHSSPSLIQGFITL